MGGFFGYRQTGKKRADQPYKKCGDHIPDAHIWDGNIVHARKESHSRGFTIGVITPVIRLFSAIYRGYPCHSIYIDRLVYAHLVAASNNDPPGTWMSQEVRITG